MVTRNILVGSLDLPNEDGSYGVNHRIIVFYKENREIFEGKNRTIDYLWKWLEWVDDQPPQELSEVVRKTIKTMEDAVETKSIEIEFKNEVELVKGKKESKAPYAWVRYGNQPRIPFEPGLPIYGILNRLLDLDKLTRA